MYIYIYKYWNGPFTVKVKQIEKKEGKAKMQTTKQTNQVFFRDTETAFMICVWRLLQRSQIHLHHALRSAGVYLCSTALKIHGPHGSAGLVLLTFSQGGLPVLQSSWTRLWNETITMTVSIYTSRFKYVYICIYIYIYARSNLDCVLMSRNLTRSMCRYNIWYVYIYIVLYISWCRRPVSAGKKRSTPFYLSFKVYSFQVPDIVWVISHYSPQKPWN